MQLDSLEFKIQSTFSEVIKDMDDVLEKISKIESSIKNFGKSKEMDSLASKTKELSSNLDNVGKKLSGSSSAMAQQMQPVTKTLEQITSKYKDLGKGFTFKGTSSQIEKQIDNLSNKLEIAKLKKQELEASGSTNGKMYEYAVRDVIKYENQIESLKNQLSSLNSPKPEIKIERIGDISKQINEEIRTVQIPASSIGYDQSVIDFVEKFSNKTETLGEKLSKLTIPEIREGNLEKLNKAIKKTEIKLEELRVKLANGLTMGTITESEDDSKYVRLQEQIALTEKTLESLRNKKMQVESASGGGGLEQLQGKLSSVASVGLKAKSALSNVYSAVSKVAKGFASGVSKVASFTKSLHKSRSASNGLSSSLSGGFKNILKYAFGIRSLYMLFNKLRRAIKDGVNNLVQYSSETNASVSLLKNSLTQLKNASASMIAPLINAFAPALNQIIQLCVKAANSVSQLLSALTGKSTWIKAKTLTDDYASSLNNASKAAKGSTRAFDELKVINSNSDSGSSGTSAKDMFETVEIESKFKELASKIQSGFVEPIKKIITDFKVGDYFQAGQDVSNFVVSINDFFARAIDNVDWYGIGTKIGEFLEGVNWVDVLSSIGRLIWEAINAGIKLWKGSFDAAPIETTIISAVALLKFTGLGPALAKAILKALVGGISIDNLPIILSNITILPGTASFDVIVGDIIVKLEDALMNLMPSDWKKVYQEIVGGIAIGALAGSWIPGFGTIAGAIVGGIIGALNNIKLPSGKSILKDIVDGLFNFDYSLKLFKEAGNFFKEVKKCFEKHDYSGVGINIVQGIIQGILGALAFLVEPIADLFKETVKAICKVFGIHSPAEEMKPYGENILLGIVGGFRNVFNEMTQAIQDFYTKHVKPMFTSEKWKSNIGSIRNAISERWTEAKRFWDSKSPLQQITANVFNIKDKLSEAWNKAKNWWNNNKPSLSEITAKIKVPHLQVSWDVDGFAAKALQKLGLKGFPNFSVKYYATGGFPEDGWFRANHGEIMGKFDNGKSVVANNMQITEGISQAVYQGNQEIVNVMRQELYETKKQNDILTQILAKEFGITKDDVGRAAQSYARDYFKRTGKEAFVF